MKVGPIQISEFVCGELATIDYIFNVKIISE